MTDPQLTAVIAALSLGSGAFVTFLKWTVGVWREDRKEERAERREDRLADREAIKAVAVALTTMTLKFDAFEKTLASVDGRVQAVKEEITDRHTVPPPHSAQPALPEPTSQYRFTRAATEPGRGRGR